MKSEILYLVFLMAFVCSSCRNEKKEQYLIAVEKALDREVVWLQEKIMSTSEKTQIVYSINGENEKFKHLIDSLDIIMTKNHELMKLRLDEDSISTFERIDKKNKLLAQFIVVEKESRKIYDRVHGLEYQRYSGRKHVVVDLEKNILKPGESLKGEINIINTPYGYSENVYHTYLNEKLVDAIDGKINILISGDSTLNYKPGLYTWNGGIVANYRGRDSLFTISKSFKIKSSLCEN
jgi:hypothetical protein